MGRAQPYQASTTLPTTTTPTMAYFSKAAALLALCMTAMVSADPLTESFLDVDLDVVAPAAGNPSNDWQWESLPTKGRVYNRDGKGRCKGVMPIAAKAGAAIPSSGVGWQPVKVVRSATGKAAAAAPNASHPHVLV